MNQPPLNPDALEAAVKAIDPGLYGDFEADLVKHAGFTEEKAREYVIAKKRRTEDFARAAVSAYLAVAQPAVNSVEEVPAKLQIISWEEEPEHECWKLAPDETFVGLIVKSGRSWTPRDKYTLNIERPAVKP